MGTASMYGHHEFSAELDSPWMTLDVLISFQNLGEGGTELDSVTAYGYDITAWVNSDYIYDLIQDYIAEADYHWSDHGN